MTKGSPLNPIPKQCSNLLYEALLLDSKEVTEVKREQRVAGPGRDRPGDIYHPDFDQGCPTFFDVTITCPTSEGNLNAASEVVGHAANRAEEGKDRKYRDRVEAAGGSFLPLAVETFGRWTPFARRTLKEIASRAAVFSRADRTTATHNLVQQLCIKLWIYNRKLLLHRLATSHSCPDWLT